jgi:hypothetical protein
MLLLLFVVVSYSSAAADIRSFTGFQLRKLALRLQLESVTLQAIPV